MARLFLGSGKSIGIPHNHVLLTVKPPCSQRVKHSCYLALSAPPLLCHNTWSRSGSINTILPLGFFCLGMLVLCMVVNTLAALGLCSVSRDAKRCSCICSYPARSVSPMCVRGVCLCKMHIDLLRDNIRGVPALLQRVPTAYLENQIIQSC